jgi:carboxyl-terminal processing protease
MTVRSTGEPPTMSRTTKIVVIALSLAVFSYAALGYVLSRTADEKSYRSLTVYSEVLNKIQEDYVEEPNMAKVSVGGLHGLVESLDAMSSYMSAAEYAEYKKQLASHSEGQLGAVLSKRSGYIMVISTQVGSPAEKAGMLPGAIIDAIAGLTTREMSPDQALQLFSGAPGKQVKYSGIKVEAGGQQPETEEKTVTLAALAPVHVTVTKLSGDTAYVRVPSLEAGKADELRAKLTDLDHSGVHKIVLDLRGCALGDVSEGIAAAKLFLSSGTIASLKGQTVAKQEFTADASKVVWKNPVVVLTSGATSGAAEVLAASIGGNKRGDVVGERTFGSASQQKLIQLDDGAAVNLTVAFYYTPDGKSIPQEGVKPTAEVTNVTDDPVAYSHAENPPLTPSDSHSDPVLNKALELLNGGKVAERRDQHHRTHSAYPIPA